MTEIKTIVVHSSDGEAMADAGGETLMLADILDDLQRVVDVAVEQNESGTASYENMQTNLPGLALHVLTYIRFLENHGYVVYDRVADQITVNDSGNDARNDGGVWRDEARKAFADHIEDAGEFDDDFDNEIDELLDSVVEADPEVIQIDDGADIAIDDDFTEIGSVPDENHVTQDFAETPESTPDPETAQNTTTDTETAMTQDSFASRRLSTGATNNTVARGVSYYDRQEAIGSGGYGTVYRGEQTKLKRLVAIKEIKEIFDVFAGVQRADIVERFTQIVQTQSALLHPNIIQVVDLDTDSQFPFVVMQYAPKGNLRRLIDTENRPDLQIAIKYFFQILHALNTAHDNGVTHGGMKPENVVLDHAGNALVTDFGISGVAELDANRGANQVYVGVGTVAYMSPEQFRNPNSSSVKSDIYSLGIMFYEMLTGKVPGRRSPMPSSFYPDIPRKLDDVFDRMSMDDPDERYDSIDEVLRDLYSATEVMKIVDKRGGFLFLRDPIEHGVVGIEGVGESASDDVELPETDGNVMNKLDKYGELFEGGDDE